MPEEKWRKLYREWRDAVRKELADEEQILRALDRDPPPDSGTESVGPGEWTWRFIPGLGATYEVSSLGTVRELVGKLKPRPVSIFHGRDGYHKVALFLPSHVKATQFYVHRLVLFAFVGPPPPRKNNAIHLDGDITNNRLSNLCWGGKSLAKSFELDRGTRYHGERVHFAKLTADQVREIRRMRRSGMTVGMISAYFPVQERAIQRILSGETWKHTP